MSYIQTQSKRIYGGKVSQGDASALAQFNATNQLDGEPLQVSTTANNRRLKGPKRTGHFSYFVRNGAASGAGSTFTVWYSNLPDPDPTNDTHWVQDASIASIDLTVANTSYFVNVGNVFAEWIRFKPSVLVSAGDLVVWSRVEGVEVQ